MRFAALSIAFAVLLSAATGAAEKPKLSLKATPVMAMSPARIVVTADLTGGTDDQVYCLGVEWDWGDGTRSEDSADCEPFEAGKTQVKRHFTADHTFRMEEPPNGVGQQPDYRDVHIQLHLKKSGKVVVSGGTTVKIKPEMDAPAASLPR
jgi:hypothetical protein